MTSGYTVTLGEAWSQLIDYFKDKAREKQEFLDSLPTTVKECVLSFEKQNCCDYRCKKVSAQHEFARRQRQEAGAGFVD